MKSTPRHAKERGQDRTFAPTAPMPHSPCPGGWCVSRRHQEQTYFAIFAVAGRLAQLVQSTSFTPRGSGVRVPHRPPRTKHKGPCNAGAFCCPNTNQARLRAGKGSKKPTRPKGGALCLFRECPLSWVHRPSHTREVVPVMPKNAPSLLAVGEVRSFEANPQCYREHHEARLPPQTNCHPPRPHHLSHRARVHIQAPPLESS